MPNRLLRRPIALVGMMGCGKTTVGRLVARRLGVPFVDSDEVIEQATGLSVTELFTREGEAAFRVRERQAIAAALNNAPRAFAPPQPITLSLSKGCTSLPPKEERAGLRQAQPERGLVLATGGGAMTDPETRRILLGQTLTVWLDAPPENLAERLAGTQDRPLLAGTGRLSAITKLLDERRPLYEQADLRLDATDSPEAVAAAILTHHRR